MEHYFGEGHINVGTGMELSILQLAGLISEVVGYTGKILCDPSKPDGKSSNAPYRFKCRLVKYIYRIQ